MYQRILVPIDGSDTAEAGLAEACRIARLTGGRLRLLHVADSLVFASGYQFYTGDLHGALVEAGTHILADAKAVVEAKGVPVDVHLADAIGSRVCDVVVSQVKEWKADLVVVGSHGRRGLSRLVMGSDAEQILRASPVPVLLVRGSRAAEPAPSATAVTTCAT